MRQWQATDLSSSPSNLSTILASSKPPTSLAALAAASFASEWTTTPPKPSPPLSTGRSPTLTDHLAQDRPARPATPVQPSSSDLSTLAAALHHAVCVIDPFPVPSPEEDPASQLEAAQLAELVAVANAERRALLLCKALAARRRELLSKLSERKEKEEASRPAELTRAETLVEEQREKRDEEIERPRRKIESIRAKEAKKLAQDLMTHGAPKVSVADMEDLSDDRLMPPHVEQLEKEVKDLHELLRIATKRIDHMEQTYRKEERPSLTQDYADQQSAVRSTFEALQKARPGNSRAAYDRAIAIEKQRSVHAAAEVAERREREEADAAARKAEEERLRAEAEQRAAEEAKVARKREKKEQLMKQRRLRDEERAANLEEARRKALREQEAEERARARAQVKTAVPECEGWRARVQAQQAAGGPTGHPQSPAQALSPATPAGPPKIGARGGGWRQRMAEKEKSAGASAGGTTPTTPLPESKKDADEFETVPEKKVWRPRRFQGQA